MRTRLAGLALAAVLGGAALPGPPRAAAPAAAPDRPRFDPHDIAYGPHPRQGLDLWLPAGEGPAPLVVWFHGGDFAAGDKREISLPIRNECYREGIAVASANYRLLRDGVHGPDFMRDGARAIQFLRSRAGEYGLDPARVAAAGDSAGGGIALWIAFHDDLADPGSEEPVLRESSRLAAAGGFRAQTSYDPIFVKQIIGGRPERHPALRAFFGPGLGALDAPASIALYRDASPLSFLSKDDPPVFLYYDGPRGRIPEGGPLADVVHHYNFGRALAERMGPLGIECELVHGEEIEAGGRLFGERFVPKEERLAAFLARRFARAEGPGPAGRDSPEADPPRN